MARPQMMLSSAGHWERTLEGEGGSSVRIMATVA